MLKRFIGVFLTLVLVASLTVGCGQNDAGADSKGTVKLAYVNWSEGIAMTNIAAAVLEEKLGYDVELTMADAAPVFTSVSTGNTDAFLDVWLPVTHQAYIEKYGDKMVDLGAVYENALIGLVVPSYVEIDSIEELNANKEMFGGEIIGIDAGAGIMAASERALEEYDLDYKLLTGSGPTMTAALSKAIDANNPIVVTGWAPHWKFAKWDLKVLEDPRGVYGEKENLHKYARLGLEEDMPEVTDFLKKFKMNEAQLGDLMGAIEESDGEPIDVAKEWMNENEDLINSWIAE
ncbi:MAG: glycine betaine ABC transporter substrate-binding protein [Eubacteriales bacterium]|nr:glycine betaine ABC transporter substrate-binding protein [Eubacteriales bacterium]MDD4390857.1 glycine betaine ABC transporter substrate-binding protein [Eubacteriales bacterium]